MREVTIGLIFVGTPRFGSVWSLPAVWILGWFGTLFATSTLLLHSMADEDVALKALHDRFIRELQDEGSGIDLWRDSSGFR